MSNLISKKVAVKMMFSGLTVAVVGFITLMLDVFNVYGKVSSCLNTPSSCNASSNKFIADIGMSAFFIGLGLIVSGIAILILSSSKRHPH